MISICFWFISLSTLICAEQTGPSSVQTGQTDDACLGATRFGFGTSEGMARPQITVLAME